MSPYIIVLPVVSMMIGVVLGTAMALLVIGRDE